MSLVVLIADQLLVDDRAARRIAADCGLLVVGTVGVLEQAALRGLLDLPEVIEGLLKTNFRVDPDVVREAIQRDAAKRKTDGPIL